MKKVMICLMLLGSLNVFAYNTKYTKLVPGKEVSVDVANQWIVSFTLETETKDREAKPQVDVVDQWAGFNCEHRQTLLQFSGFDFLKKTYKKTWEIQFVWTPGADYSGCNVTVGFPGMTDSKAVLFMNY